MPSAAPGVSDPSGQLDPLSLTKSADAPPATPPTGESVRRGLALALLTGAQLMIVLDATIVNIALPHIQKALSFSATSLSWVMNAYTLAFGGLLLLGGRLGDQLGRRRMLLSGLTVFTVASLFGGLSQNAAMLLVARALQGVGGAMIAPAVLSLMTTIFREGPERNKALGVYAAVSGGGSAVGLLAGGLLTQWLSWRWVLFVNVPIGIALVLAIPAAIPAGVRASATQSVRGHFDVPGALTSTLGVTALVYGVIRGADKGWSNGWTVSAFAAAAVLVLAFVALVLRTAKPLMPMRLFANTNRWGSYLVMVLTAAGMMAGFYFITMFVQEVLGYKPINAGLAYLPLCAGVIISAQVTSTVLPRVGARTLLTVGPLIVAGGLFYLSRLTPGAGYAADVLPSMIAIGLGMGVVFVSIMVTAVSGIDPQDAGVGSAMINVVQQIGGTVGLSALITISATATRNDQAHQARSHASQLGDPQVMDTIKLHAMTAGFTRALLVGGFMLLTGAVLAALVLRTPTRSAAQAESAPAVH